jgi:hypothetical protein
VENPVASLKVKKTTEFEAQPEAASVHLRAADLMTDSPVMSPALRLQDQLRAALGEDEQPVDRYPLVWSAAGVFAFCSAFWALVVYLAV